MNNNEIIEKTEGKEQNKLNKLIETQLICITEVNKCSQLHGVTGSKMKLKYKELK